MKKNKLQLPQPFLFVQWEQAHILTQRISRTTVFHIAEGLETLCFLEIPDEGDIVGGDRIYLVYFTHQAIQKATICRRCLKYYLAHPIMWMSRPPH